MSEGGVKRIIKGSKPARSAVLKNRTLEAESEAKRIVAEARSYARQICEKAEETAAQTLEAARLKGEEKALEKYEESLLAAARARETVIDSCESDLLELSVRIAEKILGRELSANTAAVGDIIETALKHAKQRQKLTIRVNPNDLSAAQSEMDRFSAVSKARFIDIVADPRVGSGGCLIESEVGTVDARLETQFRVLERALLSRAETKPATDEQ